MPTSVQQEIKTSLSRIETKLNGHGEDLAVIKTQVKMTNGRVNENCDHIELVEKNCNDQAKFQERLVGSFNAYKYIAVLLGALASAISIYAMLK